MLGFERFNNMLRKNALGNFGDFTKAVSKEAAMLNYSTNRTRKKAQMRILLAN